MSRIKLLMAVIVFSLVKCHHRLPFKIQLWISRIDRFTIKNIIIDIKNLISTSKKYKDDMSNQIFQITFIVTSPQHKCLGE